MRARHLIVIGLLVALGATACGSSSKSGAPPSSAPSGTTAPSATGPSGAVNTTVPSYSGSSGSNFCDLVRNDEKAFNANVATSTPADLKKLYQNLGPALDEAKSKAPDAIKGDFGTFVTAFKQLVSALAAVDYDVSKINPADVGALESPQTKAASDHIQQYITQVCHVTTSTG